MSLKNRADVLDETVCAVATTHADDDLREPATYGVNYAIMVERIFRHCEGALPACQISTVVRDCIDDLAGSPRGALPELTERLATQRVADLLGKGSTHD